MARPKTEGFAYCPEDTDIFDNPKIRMLLARYHSDGFCLYKYIVTKSFREHGYYVEWSEERTELASADLYMSLEKIGLILDYLLKRTLLKSISYNGVTVLTSHGIQKRFQKMANDAKRDYYIFREELWLVSKDETIYSIFLNPKINNSGINNNNSGIKDFNSGNITQSKVKESKVKNSKECVEKDDTHDFDLFKLTYPKIEFYDSAKLTGIDFNILLKEFSLSKKFLQNITSFELVRKLYNKIINGTYRDIQFNTEKGKEKVEVPGVHFENERKYSKEELENLMDNVDDINF